MASLSFDRIAERLIVHSGDAVVVADRDGIIRAWNPAASAMFGYDTDDAVGQSLDIVIPENLRDRHWTGFAEVMRTGVTSYADRLLAVPGIRRDGGRISLEFRVTLLVDESGAIEGIGAVIRDVTERWASERALRARLAELEETVRELQ